MNKKIILTLKKMIEFGKNQSNILKTILKTNKNNNIKIFNNNIIITKINTNFIITKNILLKSIIINCFKLIRISLK